MRFSGTVREFYSFTHPAGLSKGRGASLEETPAHVRTGISMPTSHQSSKQDIERGTGTSSLRTVSCMPQHWFACFSTSVCTIRSFSFLLPDVAVTYCPWRIRRKSPSSSMPLFGLMFTAKQHPAIMWYILQCMSHSVRRLYFLGRYVTGNSNPTCEMWYLIRACIYPKLSDPCRCVTRRHLVLLS